MYLLILHYNNVEREINEENGSKMLEKQVDKVMRKVLEAFMLLERVLLKMRKAEHPQYWILASAEEKKREDKDRREVLKLNLKRRWLVDGWVN